MEVDGVVAPEILRTCLDADCCVICASFLHNCFGACFCIIVALGVTFVLNLWRIRATRRETPRKCLVGESKLDRQRAGPQVFRKGK